MPTWDQLERIITTSGLAVFLVIFFTGAIVVGVRAVWTFTKPYIATWFDKQTSWFEAQTSLMEQFVVFMATINTASKNSKAAAIALGKAILESAPEDRRERVRPHIDRLIEILDDEYH